MIENRRNTKKVKSIESDPIDSMTGSSTGTRILFFMMISMIGCFLSCEAMAEGVKIDIDQDGTKELVSFSHTRAPTEDGETFEKILVHIHRGQKEVITFQADSTDWQWLTLSNVKYWRLADSKIILMTEVVHDNRVAGGNTDSVLSFFLINPDMAVKLLIQIEGSSFYHGSVSSSGSKEASLIIDLDGAEMFTILYQSYWEELDPESSGDDNECNQASLRTVGLVYDASVPRFVKKDHGSLEFCYQANTKGPSFDCRKAVKEAEKGICNDRDLWEMDRILASKYQQQLQQSSSEQAVQLKAAQREWLQTRNQKACASSPVCLKQSYIKRINELSNVSGKTSFQ